MGWPISEPLSPYEGLPSLRRTRGPREENGFLQLACIVDTLNRCMGGIYQWSRRCLSTPAFPCLHTLVLATLFVWFVVTSRPCARTNDLIFCFLLVSSWLYNLYDKYVGGKIKGTLQDKVRRNSTFRSLKK